ncbi:Radical SAM domain protein [hydrothermal vent metagenome]|uniref:Radical SAM domain protein n=1 Tax=hydrothermal vent metagenome TaxID=652676 RepID=A0A3B1CE47_9ZZZZ
MSNLLWRHAKSIFLKSEPIQLTLFLTSRCNAHCRYCFYSNGCGNSSRRELNVNDYRKISSSIGKLLWLAFSGGEIFLRDDIAEIVSLFYRANSPGIILLPTNGLDTQIIRAKVEQIVRECPKSVVVVKLSLDGPEDVNDSLRGVKGAFGKTMKTYKSLYELFGEYDNFELGFNSVFCASTQNSMPWLCSFIKNLDDKTTHTVSLIRGDVPSDDEKIIDIEKYKKTIATLAAGLKDGSSKIFNFNLSRLKAAQDIVQGRLICDLISKQKSAIPCLAGRLTLTITETGDVYPCESFDAKLGNIHKTQHDLRQLLNTDLAKQVIAKIASSDCHCTHECYMIMNILFNPYMYPSLIKQYAHILLKRV